MKNCFILLLLLTLTATQIQAINIPQKTLKKIKVSDLKHTMAVLTSDSLEGRATGQPGIEKAARYIENSFRNIGLEPFDSGQYRQSVPLWRSKWADIHIKTDSATLLAYHNFIYTGHTIQNEEVAKTVIYLGAINDSTSIPFDIHNQIVMVKLDSFRKTLKITSKLTRLGAWAIFYYCPSDRSQYAEMKENIHLIQSETSITTDKPDLDSTGLRLFFFPEEIEQAIFGFDHSSIPTTFNLLDHKPITGSVKIRMQHIDEPFLSYNIIGRIKGKSGKQLAITAHYDHVGQQEDSLICRGADDNGSGTTALIQLAKSFKMQKEQPECDILFIAFTGEELGLFGSKYFIDHEKPDHFIANINMDMIGRQDTVSKGDYIYMLGPGKSNWIKQLNINANKATVNLKLDYHYDGGSFMNRSDHYYFYDNNIPVASFFSGLHPDYHTPRDTMDKINFDLFKQRIKLIFATAYLIAFDPESVRLSKP